MVRFRRNVFASALLLAVVSGGTAHAQSSSAVAEALFRDGRTLMEAHKYAEACPKLAESVRLDPASGSALALAVCYKQSGKIASAWSAFVEAADLAKRDGRKDRATAAMTQAAALEKRIPHVTVNLAATLASTPGLEVRSDGVVLGQVLFGTPMPVDPGDHVFEATAPGKKTWTSAPVHIGEGESNVVPIPELEAQAASPSTTDDASKTDGGASSHASSHALGFAIGGVGVAAVLVGSYFGIRTLSKKSDVDRLCPTDTCTSASGVAENQDAHTYGTVSTVSFIVGIAALGAGTFFVLTSRGHDDEKKSGVGSLQFAPSVGPGFGEATLRGTF